MHGVWAYQEAAQLLLPVHHLPVLLRASQVPKEQVREARQRCAVDGQVEQRLCEVRSSFTPWKRRGERWVSHLQPSMADQACLERQGREVAGHLTHCHGPLQTSPDMLFMSKVLCPCNHDMSRPFAYGRVPRTSCSCTSIF